MKRKSTGEPRTPPPKQPRQDPVSCESCRKRKTKCDRQFPCGSCVSRRIDCKYGNIHGLEPLSSTMPSNPAMANSSGNDVDSSQPKKGASRTPRAINRIGRVDDLLMTADRLENILMGHRIPSAVPEAIREELSRPRLTQVSQLYADNALANILSRIPDNGFVSLGHPASIKLSSFLPSQAEALSLLDYYHQHLDYQYHIIIFARTKQQVCDLYQFISRGQSGDLNCLALLFSILATSLFYRALSKGSTEVAVLCAREMAFLAGAALIQSNYVACPTIEGLQTVMMIGHHLPSLTLNPSVSSFFLHSAIVSQAKSLGLHRIDCPRNAAERQANVQDKAQTELKRRLWWDLASYDWLIGFLSGPQEWTYTIQPQHMNVCRPLNIDDDLLEGESDMPLSTPTCMSYTLQRLKLAEVCREIVDAVAAHQLQGRELPYETVLNLDRKLQEPYSELPAYFRFDQSSCREFADIHRERPALAWQRALIQQGYHARLCRLHRQYFIRGAKDPRYSYSRVVCLESARKILELKRIMDEEEPLFTPNSSFFWAVTHHVFMAAVILLIDVCFNWDDILAYKRKAEVLDACRLLTRAHETCPVAREGIDSMMGILRKYWKQEKRTARSRDTQALRQFSPVLDPSNSHGQSATASVSHRQDFKYSRSEFLPQVHDIPPCGPTVDSVNPGAESLPLEDIWSQMLDESAHVALDTPEWMDLLTDLTNATLPSD